MTEAFRYKRGKVGDDVPLQFVLMTPSDLPRPIESARITIVSDRGVRLFNEEIASQVALNVAQYIFSTTFPSDYFIEWHLQHSGGIDEHFRDYRLLITPRRAL